MNWPDEAELGVGGGNDVTDDLVLPEAWLF